MKKIRLDVFLSEKGLSQSREKAKKDIIAGWVKVNGDTVRDPSKTINGNEEITVKRPKGIFVSRGGEKLHHALKEFNISLKDKVVVDLGASTGGFTDCMLKAGALKVYSIDVGYGQLDYSLRTDSRVVVMERTHVKDLKKENFDTAIDFITADLSFISFIKVFDKIKELFTPVEGVFLLKPQFESEPGEHKKGVVRKKEIHCSILLRVITSLIQKGMILKGLIYSPIKGPAGNIEFLVYFKIPQNMDTGIDQSDLNILIEHVVEEAHKKLE